LKWKWKNKRKFKKQEIYDIKVYFRVSGVNTWTAFHTFKRNQHCNFQPFHKILIKIEYHSLDFFVDVSSTRSELRMITYTNIGDLDELNHYRFWDIIPVFNSTSFTRQLEALENFPVFCKPQFINLILRKIPTIKIKEKKKVFVLMIHSLMQLLIQFNNLFLLFMDHQGLERPQQLLELLKLY
jgi:hypothetical protein